MSKISDVYDQLTAKTEELFSSKVRLHNPYSVGENPDIIRKDGWGIRVLSATKEDIEFCNLTLNRSFELVLVKQFVSLAGKEDGFDSSTKSILEDQQSFCSMIYAYTRLELTEKISRVEINDISGIEFQVSDEKKFLTATVNFTITVSEKL